VFSEQTVASLRGVSTAPLSRKTFVPWPQRRWAQWLGIVVLDGKHGSVLKPGWRTEPLRILISKLAVLIIHNTLLTIQQRSGPVSNLGSGSTFHSAELKLSQSMRLYGAQLLGEAPKKPAYNS